MEGSGRHAAVHGLGAGAILAVAEGLRWSDPQLSVALAEHVARSAGEDAAARSAAERSVVLALGQSDRPAELIRRAVPQLRDAEREGRATDAAVLRCELARAAVRCEDVDAAEVLLEPLAAGQVLPDAARVDALVAQAAVRAARGDVAGADAAARQVEDLLGPTSEDARRIATQRSRARARRVAGDASGALDVLRVVVGREADADGGREAAVLAADQVELLAELGHLDEARELGGPFLAVTPQPATSVPVGRLRCVLARHVALSTGDVETAARLAREAEADLRAHGHEAEAAEAIEVLADVAACRGETRHALDELRRAHAHATAAREESTRARIALAVALAHAAEEPPRRRLVDGFPWTQTATGNDRPKVPAAVADGVDGLGSAGAPATSGAADGPYVTDARPDIGTDIESRAESRADSGADSAPIEPLGMGHGAPDLDPLAPGRDAQLNGSGRGAQELGWLGPDADAWDLDPLGPGGNVQDHGSPDSGRGAEELGWLGATAADSGTEATPSGTVDESAATASRRRRRTRYRGEEDPGEALAAALAAARAGSLDSFTTDPPETSTWATDRPSAVGEGPADGAATPRSGRLARTHDRWEPTDSLLSRRHESTGDGDDAVRSARHERAPDDELGWLGDGALRNGHGAVGAGKVMRGESAVAPDIDADDRTGDGARTAAGWGDPLVNGHAAARPSVPGGVDDEYARELALTLVDLLSEYQESGVPLGDASGAAPSAPSAPTAPGDRQAPATATREGGAGPGAGARPSRGTRNGVPSARAVDDAEPRLADLLADAMDAYHSADPGATAATERRARR